MIVIRPEQMQAFQAERDARLVEWLAEYVRRNEPTLVASWDAATLRRRIGFAMQKARAYGMSDTFAISEFFVAMAELGPHFDQHPAARSILTDNDRPPDQRIHLVWKAMPPPLRDDSPLAWPGEQSA